MIYVASKSLDFTVGFIALLVGMAFAFFLKTDYSIYGVLTIYCFYLFRSRPLSMFISVFFINIVMDVGGTGSQKYAALAIIPIFLYSGRKTYFEKGDNKGSKVIQYLFYLAYPIHLLILYYVYSKYGILRL